MERLYINILLDKARGHKNYRHIKMSAKYAFLETEKELKRLNHLIRKGRKLSDRHIGNSIFENAKVGLSAIEIKTDVYDHFTAGYYSLLDIKEKMIENNCFNYIGIKKYGYIIKNVLYDLKPLANYIGQQNNPEYYFFNGFSSNIEDSIWHYKGTVQLLYNCIFDKNMLDNKFAFILSPVSLRQTLEIKAMRLLGVGDYYDLLGQKKYMPHHFFFDFMLKHKSHFEFSFIDIKIIKKVFEFCNNSVHKGLMPSYWQMFYATKFCDPLFYDFQSTQRKDYHIHSAIKIKNYNELKQKLELEFSKKFPKPNYDLHIDWLKRPEAELIS